VSTSALLLLLLLLLSFPDSRQADQTKLYQAHHLSIHLMSVTSPCLPTLFNATNTLLPPALTHPAEAEIAAVVRVAGAGAVAVTGARVATTATAAVIVGTLPISHSYPNAQTQSALSIHACRLYISDSDLCG
jgi:hypothetical protein